MAVTTQHRIRRILLPIVGALSVAALVACSAGQGGAEVPPPEPGEALVIDGVEIADADLWAAAKAEGSMTLYSAQPEATVTPIVEAFMDATGINVDVVRLSGGPLAERVMSEIAGGQLGADVLQASDLDFAAELKSVDALSEYEVPWIEDMREDLRDPDGMYTPWSTSVMTLAYNTAVVAPEDVPQSWAELLEPEWKGKIGIFDIGTGGSAWAVALFQRLEVDDDYWADLTAQEPLVYAGNAPLSESLQRGEISVGTGSPSVILRAREDGAPVDVLFPEEGFPAFVSFLAIPTTASSPNAAKVYVNWATSTPGSTKVSTISGDYQANTTVPTPTLYGTKLPESGPWIASTDDWLSLREGWSREYRELFGAAVGN